MKIRIHKTVCERFGVKPDRPTYDSIVGFTTLFISGNNMDNTSDSLVEKQTNMGFGVKIGKEYRKILVNNLELRIGADLSLSYNQSTYDYNDKTKNNYDRKNDRTIYQYGVNLVLGLNYRINDHIVFGAELLPNFSYMTGSMTDQYYYTNNGKEIKSAISGFNYGLSNTSVLLSLAYKF